MAVALRPARPGGSNVSLANHAGLGWVAGSERLREGPVNSSRHLRSSSSDDQSLHPRGQAGRSAVQGKKVMGVAASCWSPWGEPRGNLQPRRDPTTPHEPHPAAHEDHLARHESNLPPHNSRFPPGLPRPESQLLCYWT